MPTVRRILRRASWVCLIIVMSGCTASSAPPSNSSTSTEAAELGPTLTVGEQSWPATIEVQGSLYGDEQAVVGTKVAGAVASVAADIGSLVKQGDVLATLDAEDFDLRVRHAEAQVQSIRAKLGLRPGDDDAKLDRSKAPPVRQERTMVEDARGKVARGRSLLLQRAISTEEVQDLEAALRVAEARYDSSLNLVEEQIALLGVMKQELAQAVQARDDATIRAPFDGIVQHRYAAPGVYLSVGAPVCSLVRTNPLRFRAGVPERDALRVALKQSVRLDVKGLNEPLEGTITRIAPALELNSRALTIEVDIPNPNGRLRSGLFAQGEIIVEPTAIALAIPTTAVSEFAGVEKVWKVVDGQAKEVRIRSGRRDRQRIEVLSGLKAGDVILARVRGE